jgi:hypothetical protein
MDEDRELSDDTHADDEADPDIVHDDIVKRLLDYQRQLREGAPEEIAAAATTTLTAESPADELIDLTAVEAVDPSDTVTLDEPATAGATSPETATSDATDAAATGTDVTGETLSGADEDASAEVIVLRPDAPTAEAVADDTEAMTTVDASADEDLATAMTALAEAEAPTPSATSDDATSEAPTAETPAPAPEATVEPETAERIARYERSLEDLADRFATLRSSFQDMAIAADERLAEIEELLAQTQLDR